MKKGSWFILLIACLSICAFAQDQEQRIQKLEQIIQSQQERIDALQDKIQKNDSVSEVAEYVAAPDTQEEGAQFGYEARGFFLRVPDFELYITGSIQMGLAIFENDTPDDNTAYPYGVVLAFDTYMYKDFHARMEVNFMDPVISSASNGFQGPTFDGNVRLWDVFIEYLGSRDEFNNPMFALRVGQTHVPFTLEGQYNPDASISIWSAPFINAWSHGRDPGIMLWGVMSDMVEYKFGMFNGEGMNTSNGSDDFLFAANFRIYPLKKSENPNTFFHLGVIRSRNDSVSSRISNAGPAAASLSTPWGRNIFDNTGAFDFDGDGRIDGFDATMGWRTGVDVAIKVDMPLGNDKTNFIWSEFEFMYITWERDFDTGRLPFLEGVGFIYALQFRHNLTPEVDGAGVFALFKVDYSQVDNKKSDSTRPFANIPGQEIWDCTLGLGYAFNTHVSLQFNWVMSIVTEKDLYQASGTTARDDRSDGSDDIEHAWFFQVTAKW